MAVTDIETETEPLIGRRLQSVFSWYGRNRNNREGITPNRHTTRLLQAATFIEDAVNYRSVHHRVDAASLKLYRWYYTTAVQWSLYCVIFVVHILAIFEVPSSLTVSSDIRRKAVRPNPPCGVTESIEILCLLIFAIDASIKVYLVGRKGLFKHKWLLVYLIVVAISIIDWLVTICLGCNEVVRIRRMLRPFFLLQCSSVMKKTINCIKRSLPEIASVLLLLCLHIYLFTMFGMLIFPQNKSNATLIANESQTDESSVYFSSLTTSLMSLLVLLTTANNPDVMIPAYETNRLYAVYFILFLFVGTYCFLNMLTAVIYNQFRGYFLVSMESSLFRRRLGIRAAFEVLQRMECSYHLQSERQSQLFFSPWFSETVSKFSFREVLHQVYLSKHVKNKLLLELDNGYFDGQLNLCQFQEFFDVLDHNPVQRRVLVVREFNSPTLHKMQTFVSHEYFTTFCLVLALLNVLLITVELIEEYGLTLSSHSVYGTMNLLFILWYLIEQLLKGFLLGWTYYFHKWRNVFDFCITVLLVITEIVHLALYGLPFLDRTHVVQSAITLRDLVHLINMLIIVRLLRIIPQIKTMAVVVGSLHDLIHNLRPFAGIMLVVYYSFAMAGMELFRDAIKFQPELLINTTNVTTPFFECGTYEQLNYWPNNFDDFAASIVLLWDMMVVNNWHVFLNAYSAATTGWSQLFFIAWYLVSVIICLNLFTALILEAFIMKWDRTMTQHGTEEIGRACADTLYSRCPQDLFRDMLSEPVEAELLSHLEQHEFLRDFEHSMQQ